MQSLAFPKNYWIEIYWVCQVLTMGKTLEQLTVTAWKVSVFGVFLVSIFLHLDWIQRHTEYLSVFSPNAGKYGPEKLRIRILFTQCVDTKNTKKHLKSYCSIIWFEHSRVTSGGRKIFARHVLFQQHESFASNLNYNFEDILEDKKIG